MKLIYIANVRIPTEKAHGTQIMKMCENLSRANNIEVELIVSSRSNRITKDAFSFYGVKRNFKFSSLPSLGVISTKGLIGKISFLMQTICFFVCLKIKLLFVSFDILYTRDQLAGLFFSNFILEIHSLPVKPSRMYLWIWHRASKLIVLTGLMQDQLIKLGITKDKVLVAPDAVDLSEFNIDISKDAARQKLNLPLDKKIILYSGSFYLYDWKGIDVLLEASKLFSDEYLLVLVGGAPDEIVAAKNRGNTKNILFIGFVSHNFIPLYLKAADILILPNKKGDKMSEECTSPLKMFEYMASCRPIVASDLPSIREVLNVSNAVLVTPNNPISLVEGIKKIITEPIWADRLKEKAFQDVHNYTWQQRAATILNFIIK